MISKRTFLKDGGSDSTFSRSPWISLNCSAINEFCEHPEYTVYTGKRWLLRSINFRSIDFFLIKNSILKIRIKTASKILSNLRSCNLFKKYFSSNCIFLNVKCRSSKYKIAKTIMIIVNNLTIKEVTFISDKW